LPRSLRDALFEPIRAWAASEDAERGTGHGPGPWPWFAGADPIVMAVEDCIIEGWSEASITAFWGTLWRAGKGHRSHLGDFPNKQGDSVGETYLKHSFDEGVTLGPTVRPTKDYHEHHKHVDDAYRKGIESLKMDGDPRLPAKRERMEPWVGRLLALSVPLDDADRSGSRVPINRLLLAKWAGDGRTNLPLALLGEENDWHGEAGIKALGDRVFRGGEDAGEWTRLMVANGAPEALVAAYLLGPDLTVSRDLSRGLFRKTADPLDIRLQVLWATSCFTTLMDLLDAVRPGLPPGTLPDFPDLNPPDFNPV